MDETQRAEVESRYERWVGTDVGDVLWNIAVFAQAHPDYDVEQDVLDVLRRSLFDWEHEAARRGE